jgi:hypothetical protein
MENLFERRSTRLMFIGIIMVITGFVDFFYGPLIDARGFSFIGLVLIVVGLLIKRKD